MSSPQRTRERSSPSSRSTTPRPPQQAANDHTVSTFRHRLSQKEYPPDCPPLQVRWYYAVDVPKRKPFQPNEPAAAGAPAKPPKLPSKFVSFAARDSRAIEAAFQKLSEEEDAIDKESSAYSRHLEDSSHKVKLEESVQVPVNEDYLFDVDIKKRELAPVYWLGPAYDVRRGTWFFQEGNSLRPCDENLATQIEEGYLRIKPFRNNPAKPDPLTSQLAKKVLDNLAPPEDPQRPVTPNKDQPALAAAPLPQWRLFGAHLNSFVVYVDPNTALLRSDDFYGKLSSTVLGSQKLVRGYSEGVRTEKKDSSRPMTPVQGEKEKKEKEEMEKKYKRRSMPPPRTPSPGTEGDISEQTHRSELERRMSSLVIGEGTGEGKTQDEMLETEMKEDYTADEEIDDPEREIEHLLLVTHGIGQKLSMRMESVNFVHDVNVFRKTLKTVYSLSPDLQVLNDEVEEKKKNCKVQCLPVCWRHLLDFPKQSLRTNRQETDLSSGSTGYEDEYPSLADITVEGVPAVRSLMTDLALDVLLYQSATYREHIIQTVLTECNRIYKLFKQRNPSFKGKVSLVGHSLGSAILFDILCRQPLTNDTRPAMASGKPDVILDFPVESFFCLGSPIGLFQMLKGRTIASRKFYDGDLIPETIGDEPENYHASASAAVPHYHGGSLFPVSSPKCQQLFNIFHPTDPISYRIEPLVSKAMASLKPQPLPYTKRGIFSSGQLVGGISGIGQSVSRSVSNMWTSLSSGIASSILNRSLGFNDTNLPQSTSSIKVTDTDKKPPSVPGEDGQQHPPTLIDDEIETLYAGFQKRRKSAVEGEEGEGEEERLEAEEKAAQLKGEEAKVRALNATGRIDFAIQEGVFDISLIASIASHLSYWGDEDVNHFVISQLLSRQRVMKKAAGNLKGKQWSSVRIDE